MPSVTGTPLRVLRALRGGPRQAGEVGDDLALDASAAWRHLEALRREGLVAAERVVEGPGRPKKRYHLTPAGREAFPRDYGLLAAALARRVAAAEGEARLREHLAAVGRELVADLPDAGGPRERLEGLVDRYDALGFETHLEEAASGDEVTVVHANCPFLQVAREHPGCLCEGLDEDMIRAAVPGARVRLESTLARGAPRCRHRVRLPSAD